jgi:hypothetical protein
MRAIMENIVANNGTFVPNRFGGVDVVSHAMNRERSLRAGL